LIGALFSVKKLDKLLLFMNVDNLKVYSDFSQQLHENKQMDEETIKFEK